MCRPEAIESLRRRLIARGLPASYVRRATEELDDHYEDVLDDALAAGLSRSGAERAAAGALGRVERLESQFLQRSRTMVFAQRHPFLVFVALPVASLLATWIILIAVHIIMARTAVGMPSGVRHFAITLFYVATQTASTVLAVVVVRAALRCFAGVGRPLVACVVLSLLGGYIHVCTPGLSSVTSTLDAAARIGRYLLPLTILVGFHWRAIHGLAADRMPSRA